jgi:hypothetical protein
MFCAQLHNLFSALRCVDYHTIDLYSDNLCG